MNEFDPTQTRAGRYFETQRLITAVPHYHVTAHGDRFAVCMLEDEAMTPRLRAFTVVRKHVAGELLSLKLHVAAAAEVAAHLPHDSTFERVAEESAGRAMFAKFRSHLQRIGAVGGGMRFYVHAPSYLVGDRDAFKTPVLRLRLARALTVQRDVLGLGTEVGCTVKLYALPDRAGYRLGTIKFNRWRPSLEETSKWVSTPVRFGHATLHGSSFARMFDVLADRPLIVTEPGHGWES